MIAEHSVEKKQIHSQHLLNKIPMTLASMLRNYQQYTLIKCGSAVSEWIVFNVPINTL